MINLTANQEMKDAEYFFTFGYENIFGLGEVWSTWWQHLTPKEKDALTGLIQLKDRHWLFAIGSDK